jgi:DNA-damage-inducible protein D
LTDEISKGTFGKTTQAHKEYKGLGKNHSLRDNMTQIELIFMMLGETSTKQIAKSRGAQGFDENEVAAKHGGMIAGNARKQLEEATGQKVLSKDNNLHSIPTSPDLLKLPDSFDESVQRFRSSP